MIKSISVMNYLGESMTLELRFPEKSGFLVQEIEGLGPVKGDINTTSITSGDGSQFNSARVGERNIVLKLKFLEKPTIEDTRLLSYRYFPVKKYVLLVIETDRRSAMISGYVESNEPDIFSDSEGCQISIICPNPYFYSVGEDSLNTVVFSGVEPKFEFPFSNESLEEPLIVFSEIVKNVSANLAYKGDVEIGITIKIHATGDASGVKIYNLDTREIFTIDTKRLEELTGHEIIALDDITICTVKGQKSITLLREGVETNILNCVTKDSKWFQISKGDNPFAYTAETGNENLQFKVEYQTLFEGV